MSGMGTARPDTSTILLLHQQHPTSFTEMLSSLRNSKPTSEGAVKKHGDSHDPVLPLQACKLSRCKPPEPGKLAGSGPKKRNAFWRFTSSCQEASADFIPTLDPALEFKNSLRVYPSARRGCRSCFLRPFNPREPPSRSTSALANKLKSMN